MGNSEAPLSLRFISCAAVINMTGICRTSVYTIPDFPKPIKISGKHSSVQGGSRWLEHEVQNWMKSRVAIRDGV